MAPPGHGEPPGSAERGPEERQPRHRARSQGTRRPPPQPLGPHQPPQLRGCPQPSPAVHLPCIASCGAAPRRAWLCRPLRPHGRVPAIREAAPAQPSPDQLKSTQPKPGRSCTEQARPGSRFLPQAALGGCEKGGPDPPGRPRGRAAGARLPVRARPPVRVRLPVGVRLPFRAPGTALALKASGKVQRGRRRRLRAAGVPACTLVP